MTEINVQATCHLNHFIFASFRTLRTQSKDRGCSQMLHSVEKLWITTRVTWGRRNSHVKKVEYLSKAVILFVPICAVEQISALEGVQYCSDTKTSIPTFG